MYPALRLAWQMIRHHRAAALPVTGTHVSHHLCLPWDIDPWRELNNGRTLTLFDLGRIPLARRTGLIAALGATAGGSPSRGRACATAGACGSSSGSRCARAW